MYTNLAAIERRSFVYLLLLCHWHFYVVPQITSNETVDNNGRAYDKQCC
jgi:hypothetical protein